MFTIKKKKLAEGVIEEIIRMIKDEELKEGDRLPNQNAFAAQLGVSRTSLRDALNILTLHGILEQQQGRGTVIISRIPALYADRLTPPLILDSRANNELIEARKLLEVGTVELAARNATKKQILELGVIVEDMIKALKDRRIDNYTERDIAFHCHIAEASQNRVLVYLVASIRGFLEKFAKESFAVLPDLQQRSLNFHKEIYQAIKDRDVKKAREHMKRHILDIQEKLEDYFRGSEGSSQDSEEKIV